MKVKELLADPSAWTQGSMAKGADGNDTCVFGPSSISACKWCLLGAIARCYHTRPAICGQVIKKVHEALVHKGLENGSIVSWNDMPERTHAEVLALVTELDV